MSGVEEVNAVKAESVRTDLPGGRVTFLFTDLEDSSATWERRPAAARVALSYHDRTAADLTVQHAGVVVKHTGDGILAVFTSPANAVRAAIDMQKRFQEETWDGVERMRVRIGLHCGDAEPDVAAYFGTVINRAARIADVANGDQIAVSGVVVTEASEQQLPSVDFVDCGFAQLKGCGRERIFLVQAHGLAVDERPIRVRRALAGSSLPAEAGRLVGRDGELRQVVSFLESRRLVSLVGLGGIGKTRLAVAVARQRSNDFADGVVFCPLAPIDGSGSDPEAGVLAAVAEALGARRQPGQDLLWSIVNFAEGRDVLVLLDNCEHVKPAARLVADQLLSVDGPSVLVTSREALNIAGEQRVNIEPLDTSSAAVDLLVERTLERHPSFESGPHATTLRKICERVDGIPLALELAAARLNVLSPDQLLDGLKEGFRLLGAGSGEGPSGSLHATVAWSVEQLDERRRLVLASLGVFSGGFTLDAATAVLRASDEITLLDDITGLVELSLVQNRPSQGGLRFHMLETIRQFGLEQLRQSATTPGDPPSADRLLADHATHFVELAARCGEGLMTSAEADVWTQIDSESDNLRIAFDTLVRTERYEEAREMVVNLAWFATFSMRMEFFGWATRLLDVAELTDAAELWAVRSIGQYLGADAGASESASRSLELDPSDRTGLARTTLASHALNNTFDAKVSGRVTAEMLEWPSERFVEQRIVAFGLRTFHLCLLEPNPEAAAMAKMALGEAEGTGSASALTIGYWAQTIASLIVDWPTAEKSIQQGLEMAESLTSNHLISHLINGVVVHFSSLVDSVPEAAAITAREIRATMDRHYLVGASHLLAAASAVLSRAGRLDEGAALLGAMIEIGHRPRRAIRQSIEAALGDRFDAALGAGQGWSINEAGHRAVLWLDEVAAEGPTTDGEHVNDEPAGPDADSGPARPGR